jgi:CMP/dCMP kinase
MKIAIDGHSACGKSTLAKDIAHHFNLVYIDSGAMYRAVTWYFLSNSIDFTNVSEVENHLPKINIQFTENTKIFLNKEDVTESIRLPVVSESVSYVAAISEVRRRLVELQQQIASDKPVVMDGRDIGSVVFPDAELKLCITADINTRTQRRYNELIAKGIKIDKDEIKSNLLKRDHIDSTRSDSPLIQCPDAYLIDNSFLTREEQLQIAIDLIHKNVQNFNN